MAAAEAAAEDMYFLTPAETAERLGISVEDLRDLRTAKRGPQHVAFTPRSIMYFASSVENWEESQS